MIPIPNPAKNIIIAADTAENPVIFSIPPLLSYIIIQFINIVPTALWSARAIAAFCMFHKPSEILMFSESTQCPTLQLVS